MQLTSVKTIILKVIRDLGLGNREIPWQDLVEWCAEGLQHIGAYSQYVEREADIVISNFSGKLPKDFYSMRANNGSYKVVGDTVLVGFREGTVTFKYLAMPVDDEGYPLVPDNVQYATALFWKCAMQLSIRDELLNKALTFPICKQRWDWYCRQAGASTQFNSQTGQNYARFWTASVPQLNEPFSGFQVVDNNPQYLP